MKDRIHRRLAGTAPDPDPVTTARGRVPAEVAERIFDKPLIPAAVLVPLIRVGDELEVLLTRRTAHLRDHAGQISFPGGRVERQDRDVLATALRETEEEIGLGREFVEVLGYLVPQPIVTGFAVVPVVGCLRPGYRLAPDGVEVAEVFQVPLRFFLDARNVQTGIREVRGARLELFEYAWRDYRIWGATAQILRDFSHLIS